MKTILLVGVSLLGWLASGCRVCSPSGAAAPEHVVWTIRDNSTVESVNLIRRVSPNQYRVISWARFHLNGRKGGEAIHMLPPLEMAGLEAPKANVQNEWSSLCEWYEDGRLKVLDYTAGSGPLHGLSVNWDADGKINQKESGVYSNGFLVAPVDETEIARVLAFLEPYTVH